MSKKKWILAALVLLLAGILIWRLVPRSLWHITGADPEAEITIDVMKTVWENGEPDIHFYTLKTQGGEAAQILEGRGYRPDLRNLWPWGVRSVSSDGGGAVVSIHLFWDEGQKATMLTFLDPKTGHVDSRLYHPLDREALDVLVDYVIANGTRTD